MLAKRWTRWRGSCAAGLLIWAFAPLMAAHAQGVFNPPRLTQPSNADQSSQPAFSPGSHSPSDARLGDPSDANDGQPTSGRWSVLARSVEDRAIEYRQFGEGARQVLVVGPLDGETPTGVRLVELVADHLDRFPRRLNNTTVTLVRDPNPDGRFRRAAGNARGVLIDQNFATRAWRKAPSGGRWLSGRTPDSEPETRALIELLADVRPDRVVVVGTSRRVPELAYLGPAEAVARRMQREARLPLRRLDPAIEFGSLAAFAGERGLSAVLLRVPEEPAEASVWESYKRTLLAGMTFEPAEGDQDVVSAPVAAEPSQFSTSVAKSGGQLASLMAKKPVERPVATATRHDSGAKAPASPRAAPVLSAAELRLGGTVVPVPPVRRARDVRQSSKLNSRLNAPKPSGRATAGTSSGHSPLRSPGTAETRPSAAPFKSLGGSPGWRGVAPRPLTFSRPFANRQPAAVPLSAPTAVPQSGADGRKPALGGNDSATENTVQRLPPVDPNQRVSEPTSPAPIPFYPDTGY